MGGSAAAIDDGPKPGPWPASMTAVLGLRDIHKVYGATVAVRGVDLALEAGQVHAIVGENGAGKSSVALIAGPAGTGLT